MAVLPHDCDELAAGPRLSRLAIGHETLGRAEDRHAEPVANARDVRGADVLPETRRRHALELANDRLAAGVLEPDAQHAFALVGLERGVVLNEVVLLQDAGDFGFHLRHRDVDAAVLRSAGIANP